MLCPDTHQLPLLPASPQEWAVRTLQRGKEGDPGRLPAVLRAMKELREAHRFFSYLHSMGKVRWGSMGALWVHLDGIRLACRWGCP